MDSPFAWFRWSDLAERYTPGAIITTDHPTHRQWRILSIEPERNEQHDDNSPRLSMASIRMSCSEVDGPATQANMRVCIQVSNTDTQMRSPQERAQQAKRFDPGEFLVLDKMNSHPDIAQFTPSLLGWHRGTQSPAGLVPGGFHTVFVWQIVPGIRLGTADSTDPQPFWDLDNKQRSLIRQQFKETFQKMRRIRIMPIGPAKRNLVWDNSKSKLWWVGFRECHPVEDIEWSDAWFAIVGLAKAPREFWLDRNWNGDTSEWEF